MTQSEKMKTLDYDTYLKTKGLFHLAQEHAQKSTEYERALSEVLEYGERYCGHISDAIYDDWDLESALEKEGFTIKEPSHDTE